MTLGDTIAAIASGPGTSPRAIIRISGPHTAPALAALCDPAPATRGAFSSRLRLDDRRTLPIRLLRFVAPASYTGEDAAELILPGNPTLLDRIMGRLLSRSGVRQAEPGEFSARAYLNGKLPLESAEAVAALIAASSAEQFDAARRLLSGHTGARYRAWTQEAATLLALVEAGIDFSDQEGVVAIAPAVLARRINALADDIASLLGARAGREHARHTPLAVLVGPPNAGKSTLFNALLGRPRALVSPIPGTTRDVLAEPLELRQPDAGSLTITLADLAGLDHDASHPIDIAAQTLARSALAEADIILMCDDSGRFTPPPGIRANTGIIRLHTKADRPALAAAADDPGVLPVCAIDGWNLDALRARLFDAAWQAGPGLSRDLLPRHRLALSAAHAELVALASSPDVRSAAHPELIAGSLRAALDALGELTGRIHPDEILGRVFATFCIGK